MSTSSCCDKGRRQPTSSGAARPTSETASEALSGTSRSASASPESAAANACSALGLLRLAAELAEQGRSFAMLTVVRVNSPTSGKPGDRALLTQDGHWHGWVGGSCAEPAARRLARAALTDGSSRLLRLTNEPLSESLPGVEVLPMSCFSGGMLEIFIEPHLAPPSLIVFGSSPVAQALVRLGQALNHTVRHCSEPVDTAADLRQLSPPTPGDAVLLATHGRGEREALRWALAGDATYVGLVASRKRSQAVRQALREDGYTEAELARLDCPAGNDWGATACEDVALSIVSKIREKACRIQRDGALTCSSMVDEAVAASDGDGSSAQAGDGSSAQAGDGSSAQAGEALPCGALPCGSLPGGSLPGGSLPGDAPSHDLPTFAAVLLAAGSSRRMGEPNKLLLAYQGKSLVRRAAELLLAASCEQLVVVTGHEAGAIEAELEGLQVAFAHNEQHETGQQASVRTGLGALKEGTDAVMICLADQPLLSAQDISALMAAFIARGDADVVIPRVGGQRGNPVVMTRQAARAALARNRSQACRRFISENQDRVRFWETDRAAFVSDIDEPSEYASLTQEPT